MKCPIDGNTLTMSERSGIEIDYCPTCRGVWLDRGELDKILDRAAGPSPVTSATAPVAPVAGPVAASAPAPRLAWSGDRRHGQRGYDGYGQSGQSSRRKKHWLNEIFD